MHQPPGMVSTGLKVFILQTNSTVHIFFSWDKKLSKRERAIKQDGCWGFDACGGLCICICVCICLFYLCLYLCIFIWLMVWCLRRALNSANVPHKKFPSCPRRGTLPIIFILITLQCWVWSFIVRYFIVRILDVANVVIQMLNSAILEQNYIILLLKMRRLVKTKQ